MTRTLRCLLAVPLVLGGAAAEAEAIKKCRDASGQWHYGDTAPAACAGSKVIVIDEHGVARREIGPPGGEDDLRAREAERAARERVRAQAKRDEMLLATYAHEDDILYVRDRRLTQLEATVRASVDTLKPLRATLDRLEKQAFEEEHAGGGVSAQTEQALARTRSQIARHEAAIERRRAEQEAVRRQAQQDLERYRQLKSQGVREAQAPR